MGPRAGLCYMAVFYGIVMNVIHMALQIGFIPYLMLPIAPLPQIVLASDIFQQSHALFDKRFCETAFDRFPATWEIIVIRRKPHDHMQMVRQDHESRYFKGTQQPDFTKSEAQRI